MSKKKPNKLPSQEKLNALFYYEDGKLMRNTIDPNGVLAQDYSLQYINTHNNSYSGKEAGHEFVSTKGVKSKQVRIFGVPYYVHRIIFKMLLDEEPQIIDHINGNPVDNRIENLRSVDNITNARNAKRNVKNTSGHTGVSWAKHCNKWEAYIWDDMSKINLGLYVDLEDAVKARFIAEKGLGYHENHGRVISKECF